MNKGIIYCTKIREEYEGAQMEHMIAVFFLEIALKKEYGINLYNEPRAEGEHGKPFLSYRPSLHYNISHSGKYVVSILADQEVGIDVQIHCRANYERMLRRMVPREQYLEILSDIKVEKKFFLRMETPFSYKRECCTFQGSFQGIAPALTAFDLGGKICSFFAIRKGQNEHDGKRYRDRSQTPASAHGSGAGRQGHNGRTRP